MNYKDHYESKLAIISSIPDEKISTPVNIPVYIYIQEAEDLRSWCMSDKDKLIAGGLDWSLIVDLPARIDTLRQAESIWNASTDRVILNSRWKEIITEARELRQTILHHMRFIYRKDPLTLKWIRELGRGNSHEVIIQSLYNIAAFGEDRIEILEAANFDTTQISRAASLSKEMSSLCAVVKTTRINTDKKYKIRNQAFTHLEEAVKEIKFHAKHIFWKDPQKLKHYRSQYRLSKNRKHRENSAAKEAMLNSAEHITAQNHFNVTAKPCVGTRNAETATLKPVTKIFKPETNRQDTRTNSLKSETNRSDSRTKSAEPEMNTIERFINTPKVYPAHYEQCNNIVIH